MTIRTSMALAAFFALTMTAAPAWAQHGDHDHGADKGAAGHSHERAEVHGGEVVMSEAHHFEVVFHSGEVRVYVYGPKQSPLEPKDASGSVSLRGKTDGATTQTLTYTAANKKAGSTQGYLRAAHDFSSSKAGELKATFELKGLPGAKATARFVQTYEPSPVVRYVCPMNCVEGGHPDPIRCPKCGMKLNKKATRSDGHGDHGDHGGDHDSAGKKKDDHSGHGH